MYHRLQALVAMNYGGLGPNNVGQNPYTPMIGQTFQKPISGSDTRLPPVSNRAVNAQRLISR
jgi:hypothetical protein